MTMVLEEQHTDADVVHILIADDHAPTRGAMRQALGLDLDGADIREAGDVAGLRRALAAGDAPHLILLDLSMPGVGGLPGLLYLRSQYPDVPVVVVSAADDAAVMRRCIEAGAAGFVPKDAAVELVPEAVRMVLDGEIWAPWDLGAAVPADPAADDTMRRLAHLTPQQLRVLTMLTRGLLNKQIAYELGVSEATIKAHVSAILQKLDVEGRTQAVLAASKVGCLRRDAPRS